MFSISTNTEQSTQVESTKVADNHLPNRWTLQITWEVRAVCALTCNSNSMEERVAHHSFKTCLFQVHVQISLKAMQVITLAE